jgi:hypothetical protein
MRKFLSAPYWVHLLVDTIIGQSLWWGISKVLETPILARSIIAGAIFIATIFAIARYLPKLSPSQDLAPAKTKVPSILPRLMHDGVLWEDRGDHYPYGSTRINGPLCPKDCTPLGIKYGDTIETTFRDDTLVSGYDYHHKLACLECNTEYTLGDKPKTIERSRNEVKSRFEGKKRREESNVEG